VIVVIQKIQMKRLSIASPWVEWLGGSQYFHSPAASIAEAAVVRGVCSDITYERSFGLS
jgi:hypothetical protein